MELYGIILYRKEEMVSSSNYTVIIYFLGINKMLSAYDDQSAYALCTFGFTSGPGQPIETFQGRTDVSHTPL